MNQRDRESDDTAPAQRLHGPESFAALVLTSAALMAVAALHMAWYVPTVLILFLSGLAMSLTTGKQRKIGMGMLAATVSALLLRYVFWLFLYTIPGMFLALFSTKDATHIQW
ncbi:hypothetical protein Srot_0088 [Segniliparus rotundus DSM 44985]|uniref:Uncharacterized protein n=2 Tax=Segniliparus rotundus TaxID=286802 RepID=D6Z9Q3_SEGRD|nr:hypothetical protein Srot_0088 [Segniliparus rotundus DSM 44985]